MTKKRKTANPAVNPPTQADGHNLGTEPGQEQQKPRRDRQNTGSAAGTNVHSKNQGRQEGQGVNRDAHSEKGDARRPSKD